MKRYVCENCHGRSKVDIETYHFDAGQVDPIIETIDCPLCVKIGAPPFIEVPHQVNQVEIDLNPNETARLHRVRERTRKIYQLADSYYRAGNLDSVARLLNELDFASLEMEEILTWMTIAKWPLFKGKEFVAGVDFLARAKIEVEKRDPKNAKSMMIGLD